MNKKKMQELHDKHCFMFFDDKGTKCNGPCDFTMAIEDAYVVGRRDGLAEAAEAQGRR